jgi:MATE family multidrug resistance protein
MKNILKLTAFAFPISASALINMIANFAAMFMVAKLGTLELAAGALAVSTYITISMIVTPIFYAVGIIISHDTSPEEHYSRTRQIVINGFWIAIFLAIPASLLLWHADDILWLFGQSKELVALTQSYFHYAALSILPLLISNVIIQFYTGIGRPRLNMMTSIISFPSMLILSYCLILGKWGFPQLDLAGVACAMLIVQTASCILRLIYMFIGKEIRKYRIFFGNVKPNPILIKSILLLGLPIGIQFGGELAAMTVSTYYMGHFGATALAATQIVSQYSMLVVMVTLGLSQALSVLTSEAHGRKDFALIKEYVRSSIIALSLFFTIILILFLAMPNYLIHAFVSHDNLANKDEVIHLAVIFIAISGLMLFIDGIRNLLSGALRGLQDSKAPMNIGLFCLWIISLPASYIIAFDFNGGPIGLRLGFMSGFIVATFLLWIRMSAKTNLLTTTPSEELTEHSDRRLGLLHNGSHENTQ